MPLKSSSLDFSRFLMGQSVALRPAFYYAYTTMWVHLLILTKIAVFFIDQPLADSLISVNMSSLSMSLIVYGLFVRQYLYCINTVPYCLSMAHLHYPLDLAPAYSLLVIVLLVVSVHGVLLREYECFAEKIDNSKSTTLPSWLNASLTGILALVVLVGLGLH